VRFERIYSLEKLCRFCVTGAAVEKRQQAALVLAAVRDY
jgi:hypothetical protein